MKFLSRTSELHRRFSQNRKMLVILFAFLCLSLFAALSTGESLEERGGRCDGGCEGYGDGYGYTGGHTDGCSRPNHINFHCTLRRKAILRGFLLLNFSCSLARLCKASKFFLCYRNRLCLVSNPFTRLGHENLGKMEQLPYSFSHPNLIQCSQPPVASLDVETKRFSCLRFHFTKEIMHAFPPVRPSSNAGDSCKQNFPNFSFRLT